MKKNSVIYALTYDAQGWEQRTLIGTATSKGVAYMFAESVKKLYPAIRIIYADGRETVISKD